MKTKILVSVMIVALGWCTTLNAQTNVSGLISTSTTWTLAGSPFIVIGNTLVDEGVTLNIDAGVTIRFDELMALQVDGELVARGNSINKITFTSNKFNPAPDDWDFILFSNTSTDAVFDENSNYVSGSVMEYCVVEFAGGGEYTFGAIMADNALPYIHHCTIQHNGASGIYANNIPGTLRIIGNIITGNTAPTGGGINAWGGYVIIEGNTIEGNEASSSYGGGGIFAYSNTTEIFNNLISGNTSIGYGAGGGGGGIYIRQGNSTISKNIIRNNILNSNYSEGEGGGILSYLSNVTITQNKITQNIGGNGGGIFGGNLISGNCISGNIAENKGGAIYMSQNSVTGNSIVYNLAEQGSVIDIYIADSPYEFKYNTITGNYTTGENPAYSMGISAHPSINFNNFFGNTATFELYNNNGSLLAHLDAKENWWGTTAETEIQGLIYDWLDNASIGIVDYSPFATSIRSDVPISPPSGLTLTEGEGQISLSWNTNSEPDLAGYKVHWGATNNYPYENTLDLGNETSYTITGLSSGNYFASVTAYDNSADTVTDNPETIVNEIQCAGNESWYAKAVSTLGINESGINNDVGVEVFPNPTNRNITVVIPPSATEIQILSSLGQIVQKAAVEGQTNWDFELKDTGTYLIQVTTDEQIITRKVIVY